MTTTTILHQIPALTINLADATVSILQHAFWLRSQKQILPKKRFREMLAAIGWSHGESRIYLKVADTFERFSPDELKDVEPNTILVLAKHQNKYRQVIEKLLDCGRITQEIVRDLIASVCKPQTPKSDKLSIWKTARDGKPVCRIPDIMEEDRQTGKIIQQEMDENGTIPQTIIREAVELWQAFRDGKLAFVEDSVGVGEEVENPIGDNLDINDSEVSEDVGVEEQYSTEIRVHSDLNNVENYQPESEELVSHQVDNISDFEMVKVNAKIIPQDDVLESEISLKEELLSALKTGKTWSEIIVFTETYSQQVKIESWNLLDTESKGKLLQLKEEFEKTPKINYQKANYQT
ncbi:hypothetical protein [Brunnivagina elsteri]|uniref:Uncharacterized protein n=1 Tax=Brunnivagina elsteri CCALA 953 TaxID=987040 RepID=A0A2A2TKR3_9CYAN|nr:hypothetical protein [Calothrix elsteri]PAX57124.1 hypothetical protein CK510_09470 [Calothrix elsteri CCALA 953]